MSILTSELNIKNLVLRNRLVMPPMATPKTADDGLVTDELCLYYEKRSRGLGMVITEHSYVNIVGKAHRGQLSIAEDAVISGLKELTDTIHSNGTAVFAQLSHAGGQTCPDITGHASVAPSRLVLPKSKKGIPLPTELTNAQIQTLIADFTRAAVRAKMAGYDGVEFHSAHGYLLNQFFSPLSNKRTDSYTGATLAGRVRLHVEIVTAVREAVGTDYPIALRLAASDFIEGGITLADAVSAAQLLETAGVNVLDISGGFLGYTRPGHQKSGYYSDLSRAIRNHVRIPVIVTGGITTGGEAEALLQAGDADLIGIGRALLKDPDWTRKNI